ncbi:MAG: metalloregulator ArsR/SmtB family transcription factor [Zoogloeaceae bacterium]|jgi:DNA-binding transcriptional ArsR family regulator|nr:metalloregulator ArsR/SmtB family transcription factor [Zoogloeaceae bacterium]
MKPGSLPFSLHDPEVLRVHADAACALLKALSNTDRLMLLCCMGGERRNVGELEAATGIRQPSLSQQLAVLRQEGLVTTEKEGKYVYYRLSDPRALRLMQTLAGIFCAAP